MRAVPAVRPETRPVVELTEATDVVLLAHVPPDAELLSVVFVPVQIDVVPLIVPTPGAAFTVTVRTAVPVE
jgi:hypothetical protein